MLMPIFGGGLDEWWIEAPELPNEYIELAGHRFMVCCGRQMSPGHNPDDPDSPPMTEGPLLWWLATDEASAKIFFDDIVLAHHFGPRHVIPASQHEVI